MQINSMSESELPNLIENDSWVPAAAANRLARLRAKRMAVDDASVCMERAVILRDAVAKYAAAGHVSRQGLIIRDLCAKISTVIDPDDLTVGRMPEVVPTIEEEKFLTAHPEYFVSPGVPGILDSIQLYIPDWSRLLICGIRGLIYEAESYRDRIQDREKEAPVRREFLDSCMMSLNAVSNLIRRYAKEARNKAAAADSEARCRELLAIAASCERVAWDAPADFRDALQLFRIMHMVLSCLIGARDVTPGRMDQYLYPFYRDAIAQGRITRVEAVELLAELFLSLSQMAGHGLEWWDNHKRSPCEFTHIYVTVGGCNTEGSCVVNDLSYVIIDAIRLLRFREPTLVVRYSSESPELFRQQMGRLAWDRLPVTIYNDNTVIRALVRHGVPLADARQYAFCACHNVFVLGTQSAVISTQFHNMPFYLLLAMTGGLDPVTGRQVGETTLPSEEIDTFEKLWECLRAQIAFALAKTRHTIEEQWHIYEEASPMLSNCLMESSMREQRSCWISASVSQCNQHLMGLGNVVDALTVLCRLVYQDRELTLSAVVDIMRTNWAGHESLRQRIRNTLPKFGQDIAETNTLANHLGRLWIDEVDRVNSGLRGVQMWPDFYSHMYHVFAGEQTAATPDGRMSGDPLSENQGPSFGAPKLSPTSVLKAMSNLPFDFTPSGATSLTLSPATLTGEEGLMKLLALIETYFLLGGLHLQINVLDAATLKAALAEPEKHAGLMVRVTGFSAYFVSLTRQVQEDIIARYERDRG